MIKPPRTQGTLRFKGKPGDLKWGKFDYPVTRTQKNALDAIEYMLSSLPRAYDNDSLPQNGFYSQHPINGAVVLGLNHQSINIHRSGRITSNQGK